MATTTAIFKKIKDAGKPLDITQELTVSDLIRYTVSAGGPFVTGAPQSNTLTEGAEVLLSPLATIAADTLTNPMTVANVLLFKEVSEGGTAAGALRRITLTSSDTALVDETYTFDYIAFEEKLFDSEIFAVGSRTLTFNAPVRSAPKKTRIHRVLINANTEDVTVTFAPGAWKTMGTTDDQSDIIVANGENVTLEFTSSALSSDNYVRVLGGWGGPSLDVAALMGGFMYLPAEDPANHIYAMNGQTLTGGVATYPEIAAKWPGWISGANLVLPDWRGRAMMATGALGITGAVGATYSDATARNGLRIVYTNSGGAVDFAGGSTQFNNGGSTWQNANTAQNNFGGLTGDTETRPNAVGLVLCVIAGRLKVTTVDADLPTSMHITSVSGNQNGNGFTANGVYVSNNTGPLTGTIFGNWTWRVKVTRFGDFVQQQYWNDTGNIAFRESFNGGTSWTGWAA